MCDAIFGPTSCGTKSSVTTESAFENGIVPANGARRLYRGGSGCDERCRTAPMMGATNKGSPRSGPPYELETSPTWRSSRSVWLHASLTFFEKSAYMLRQVCQKFYVGWLRIRAGDLVGRRDLRGLRIHGLLPNRGVNYPLARGLVTATPGFASTCVARRAHGAGAVQP